MTTDQLVSYYQNLLAVQYKTLPRAVGTIGALAVEAVADQIYSQVLQGFDVETAIGKQLDIIGEYVGVSRKIFNYDPNIPYFALYDYSQALAANTGLADYSDSSDPIDFWLDYGTTETSYTLTDGQFRMLILYVIALHKDPHTLASIDLLLQTFFGSYCTMVDGMNMSVTYTHLSSDPNILFSVVNQLGLLPHPAGVSIVVVEV